MVDHHWLGFGYGSADKVRLRQEECGRQDLAVLPTLPLRCLKIVGKVRQACAADNKSPPLPLPFFFSITHHAHLISPSLSITAFFSPLSFIAVLETSSLSLDGELASTLIYPVSKAPSRPASNFTFIRSTQLETISNQVRHIDR